MVLSGYIQERHWARSIYRQNGNGNGRKSPSAAPFIITCLPAHQRTHPFLLWHSKWTGNCMVGPQTMNICWVITMCGGQNSLRCVDFVLYGFHWNKRIKILTSNDLFPNNKNVEGSVILKSTACFFSSLPYCSRSSATTLGRAAVISNLWMRRWSTGSMHLVRYPLLYGTGRWPFRLSFSLRRHCLSKMILIRVSGRTLFFNSFIGNTTWQVRAYILTQGSPESILGGFPGFLKHRSSVREFLKSHEFHDTTVT